MEVAGVEYRMTSGVLEYVYKCFSDGGGGCGVQNDPWFIISVVRVYISVMEVIGVEYRMIPGIFFQGWFALGYITLSGVAYIIRDYRYLYLTISLFPTIFLSYYW